MTLQQQQNQNFQLISQNLAASMQNLEQQLSEKIDAMETKFLQNQNNKSGKMKAENRFGGSVEAPGLGQPSDSASREPQAKKSKLGTEKEYEYDEHDFDTGDDRNESDCHSEADLSSYMQGIDDFLNTQQPLNDKEDTSSNDIF